MSLIEPDELAEFSRILKSRQYDFMDFDLREIDMTDPKSDELLPITGCVEIRKTSNGAVRVYPTGDGTFWPYGFQRDLEAGQFLEGQPPWRLDAPIPPTPEPGGPVTGGDLKSDRAMLEDSDRDIALFQPCQFALDSCMSTASSTLIDLLGKRGDTRELSDTEPSRYALSRLLWCAARSIDDSRAARIRMYVSIGSLFYEFDGTRLIRIAPVDVAPGRPPELMRDTGLPPLSIMYATDECADEMPLQFNSALQAAVRIGSACENVSLSCTAEGMIAHLLDKDLRDRLAARVPLRAGQQVLVAQALGYPRGATATPQSKRFR